MYTLKARVPKGLVYDPAMKRPRANGSGSASLSGRGRSPGISRKDATGSNGSCNPSSNSATKSLAKTTLPLLVCAGGLISRMAARCCGAVEGHAPFGINFCKVWRMAWVAVAAPFPRLSRSARIASRIVVIMCSLMFKVLSFSWSSSENASRECGFHVGTGMQGAEYIDAFNGCQREFRRYVVRNARQAENMDLQALSRRLHCLKIGARIVLQTEHETLARNRLLDDIRVGAQLIADCCANQVCAVRVKPFLNQQIDLPEIDQSKVDGDFFGFADLGTNFSNAHLSSIYHPYRFHMDSIWMVVYIIEAACQTNLQAAGDYCESLRRCGEQPRRQGRRLGPLERPLGLVGQL